MSVITGPSHVFLPMVPGDGLLESALQHPNLSHKRLSTPARPQQLSRVPTSPPTSPLQETSWCTAAQHVDVARRPVTPRRRTMANIFSSGEESSTCQQGCADRHKMSSSTMQTFSPEKYDYELAQGKKIGSGRWSTVYLAPSILVSTNPSVDLITPPTTPTRSRRSTSFPGSRPECYAVKVAANRSAIKALKEEAAILSHLSLFSGCEKHIVPFHGYDTRNNSVIFSALPASLEDLIGNELPCLDDASRVTKVASIFPRMTKALTKSLAWLHAANVVHADLKPANILLQPDLPVVPGTSLLDVSCTPVLADFTSSFRTDVHTSASTASAMGGGTYDFLSPELLARPYPPPSAASDVYALAITLLEVLIGTSPYATARGNRFQLLEMAKAGRPIDFAMQEPRSEARLRNTAEAIRQATGLDVIESLKLGLTESPDVRISARAWCTMF